MAEPLEKELELLDVLKDIQISNQKSVETSEAFGELTRTILDQNGKLNEQLVNFFQKKEDEAKLEEDARRNQEVSEKNARIETLELELSDAKRKSALGYNDRKPEKLSKEESLRRIATAIANSARQEFENTGFGNNRSHSIMKDGKLNVSYSGIQISDDPIEYEVDCDTSTGCYAGMFALENRPCTTPEEKIKSSAVNGDLDAWIRANPVPKKTLTFSETKKDLLRWTVPAIFDDLPDDCFHSESNSRFIDLIMNGWFEKEGEALDRIIAGYDAQLSLAPYSVGVGASGNNTGLAPFPTSITTSTKFDRLMWGVLQLKTAGVPTERIKVILSRADYNELFLLQNNQGYIHTQLLNGCTSNLICPFNAELIDCKSLDGKGVAHWIDTANGKFSSYGDLKVETFVDTDYAKLNKKMMRIERDYSFHTFCPSKFIVNAL